MSTHKRAAWAGQLIPVARESEEPTAVAPNDDAASKPFATLQAIAALRGYRLDRIEADDGAPMFVVSRWALTKQLRDLQDVREFLERAGASA